MLKATILLKKKHFSNYINIRLHIFAKKTNIFVFFKVFLIKSNKHSCFLFYKYSEHQDFILIKCSNNSVILLIINYLLIFFNKNGENSTKNR
jgi:hypothetical protein